MNEFFCSAWHLAKGLNHYKKHSELTPSMAESLTELDKSFDLSPKLGHTCEPFPCMHVLGDPPQLCTLSDPSPHHIFIKLSGVQLSVYLTEGDQTDARKVMEWHGFQSFQL